MYLYVCAMPWDVMLRHIMLCCVTSRCVVQDGMALHHAIWVSVKKHSSGEDDVRETKPPELQIRGRRAVSTAGSQGEGSQHAEFLSADTGAMISALLLGGTTCLTLLV